MMVAPATVVVATEAASGYGGGRLGFALASSGDGDAVEGGTDPSSHEPGVFGSKWRHRVRVRCEAATEVARGANWNRQSSTVLDVSASGRHVAAGTIESDSGSPTAVRTLCELAIR